MKLAAAAAVALAALPSSEAFSAPMSLHGLQLATGSGAFCKPGQPLTYMKRARSAAVGDMKMELLGKRYWLWNVSEWALDKFIALTQVAGALSSSAPQPASVRDVVIIFARALNLCQTGPGASPDAQM